MANQLVESVGARLVLTGRSRFVADAIASSDSMKVLRDSILEVSAAAGEMSANVDRSVIAESIATKSAADSAKAAAASADAAALASKRRMTAITEESGVLDAATLSASRYSTVITGLAGNPLIRGAALFGGGALALGAYEGIKQYTAFQAKMTQSVTLAGVPMKTLNGLMSNALAISKATGISALNVAQQYYRISSNNAGLKETAGLLERQESAVAKLSVILGLTQPGDIDQVARIFGAITNAGRNNALQGTGGRNYNQIAAETAAAVGVGDLKGTEISGFLGKGVLQVGQALHLNLADILTMAAIQTRFASNPSTAGTLTAHFLNQLATPTEQGVKAEGMVGVYPGQLEKMMQNPKVGVGGAVKYLWSAFGKGLAYGSTSLANYPSFGGNPAGPQSAAAQLQAWGMQMSPGEYQAFTTGRGITPAMRRQMQTTLATKAFGGARQEVPFLTVAANPQLYAAAHGYILSHGNATDFNRNLAITEQTPAFQQAKAINEFKLTLMSFGQQMTGFYTKGLRYLGDMAAWFGENKGVLKALLGIGVAVVGFSTGIIVLHKMAQAWGYLKDAYQTITGTSTGGLMGEMVSQQIVTNDLLGRIAMENGINGFGGARGSGQGMFPGMGGAEADTAGFWSKSRGATGFAGVLETGAIAVGITDLIGHGLQAIFQNPKSYGNRLGHAMTPTGFFGDIHTIAMNLASIHRSKVKLAASTNLPGVIPGYYAGGDGRSVTVATTCQPPKQRALFAWDAAHNDIPGLERYIAKMKGIEAANPGVNNATGNNALAQANLAGLAIDKIIKSVSPKTTSGKTTSQVFDNLDTHVDNLGQIVKELRAERHPGLCQRYADGQAGERSEQGSHRSHGRQCWPIRSGHLASL